MANLRTALIIPTYNAAGTLSLLLNTIQRQTIKPDHILVIDSSSSDTTTEILKAHNIPYTTIKKSDFNHGTTRKYATSLTDADVYMFLTQDVSFANEHAIESILKAFTDEKVGCAYGRQLPNKDAAVLVAHQRLFNYPATSSIKTYKDRKHLGINVCMNSDNFAAYRKTALLDIGGLPENVIVSEDMYAAAKMLMHGWKIAYKSDALIYHSHNYTTAQEFKRYFDIGVFHAMNPWILETFNSHIGDGFKYLQSAIKYCINNRAYFTLPKVIINGLMMYLGFFIGRHYTLIPNSIRKKISMCGFFWK
ncbi:MAG: Glycosyl transferase, family 2 [uncultured bacterium]|nr:MAG: Glycosyl transferase, family 2 [uncultured bacterium]